jgi:hypothetical protein
MKSIAQRYLIATVFFVAAELWVGIGLLSGLQCLLAFTLASAVVAVVQRRRLVAARGRARASARGGARRSRPAAAAPRTRPRPLPPEPKPLYDDDSASVGWPQMARDRW